jgi:hypothetical protein
MKKQYLLSSCLLLSMINLTLASPCIDILSQNYRVTGYYLTYEAVWDPDIMDFEYIEVSDSYGLSNTSAVSGEVTYMATGGRLFRARSSAGPLGVSANADASPGYIPWNTAYASAEATWVFCPKPGITYLEIPFEVEYYTCPCMKNKIKVWDLSVDTVLFSWEKTGLSMGVEKFVVPLTLDPSHEYSLYMEAFAHASDDFGWYSNLSVNIIPVPSAILLGSIGVGLVGWLRMRKTI